MPNCERHPYSLWTQARGLLHTANVLVGAMPKKHIVTRKNDPTARIALNVSQQNVEALAPNSK
jgi:hypothetical protein